LDNQDHFGRGKFVPRVEKLGAGRVIDPNQSESRKLHEFNNLRIHILLKQRLTEPHEFMIA